MVFKRFGFLWLLVILVACNSQEPTEMRVSPSELMLKQERTGSLNLENVGEYAAPWYVHIDHSSDNPEAGDWFSITPRTGKLSPNATVTISMQPVQNLAEGSYASTLSIRYPGSEQLVRIFGDIISSPCDGSLSVSAETRTRERPAPNGLPYVPGELLVAYAPPTDDLRLQNQETAYRKVADTVATHYKFQTVKTGSLQRPDLIQLPAEQNVLEAAKQLSRDPRVAYAEPNYYLEPLAVPTDPSYTEQWYLSDFGLPQAWERTTGSSTVTIAIIDSSVDTDHEDLVAKMLPGCDLHDRDEDPNSDLKIKTAGHGTHVAGIAAASGNNDLGIAGLAFEGVQILPVKIFDDNGVEATFDDLIDGIRWSVGLPVEGLARNPNPARILNLSLGALATSQAINEAVTQAKNTGAIIFAASGNDSMSNQIRTPANSPDAIAIGSVDASRQRSSFSNYATNGPSIDFVAPGGAGPASCGGILSTFPDDAYVCQQGTSMATPFVSGVAALIWSQNPDFSAEQVLERLKSSTFFDPSWDEDAYGNGLVCADRALGAETLCGQ